MILKILTKNLLPVYILSKLEITKVAKNIFLSNFKEYKMLQSNIISPSGRIRVPLYETDTIFVQVAKNFEITVSGTAW